MHTNTHHVFEPGENYRYIHAMNNYVIRAGRTFETDTEGAVPATGVGGVLWGNSLPRGREPRYRVQRRVGLDDRSIWSDEHGRVVVSLADEGVRQRADGRDGSTGAHLWSRPIPLPRPTWFTERDIPKQIESEVLQGFLLLEPSALIVAVQRHTRRSEMWSDAFPFVPAPPFQCRLEAQRWEPATGATVWKAAYDGVHVDLLERGYSFGFGVRHGAFGVINFDNGDWRELLRADADCHSMPQRIGSDVVCVSCLRGVVTVWVVDFSHRSPQVKLQRAYRPTPV